MRGHEAHGESKHPSLKSMCLEFLHKMKVTGHHQSPLIHRRADTYQTRFGSHSRESCIIHEVLDAFQNRKVTKRHAHSTIVDALGGEDDLQRNLMNILYHPDSRWAPGDFDLPTIQPDRPEQPLPESTPLFLEPSHHPQMRMPSAPFSWSSSSLASHSINPAVLSRYTEYSSMESSPPVSIPGRFSGPPIFEIPSMDEPTITSTPPGLGFDPRVGFMQHRQWESSSHDHKKAAFEPDHLPRDGDVRGYPRLPIPCQVSTHQPTPWNPYLMETSPEDSEVSQMLKFPRILPKPIKICDHPQPSPDGETEEQRKSPRSLEQYSPTTTRPSPTSHPGQAEKTEKKTMRNFAPGGIFIHALCGKGFSSRYKVRKHHWGAKNDDLSTTTGCWAKYGKPNSSWDDHRSCKVSSARARAAKTQADDADMAQRVPMSATTISGTEAATIPDVLKEPLRTLPGFPTLQNLPQTVAAALKTYSGDEYLHNAQPRYYAQSAPWNKPGSPTVLPNALPWTKTSTREERNDSVTSLSKAQVTLRKHDKQHMTGNML